MTLNRIIISACLVLAGALSASAQADSLRQAAQADSAYRAARAALADSVASAEADASLQLANTDGETLAAQADSAYMADEYARAEALYLQAMKASGTSPRLFYNLGNAYYRQDNLGMAIVSYERALRLDPTMDDARANLDFVRSRLTDKPLDEGQSMMDRAAGGLVETFQADTWAWIAVFLLVVTAACAALYFFATSTALRKVGFFGGGVMALVMIAVLMISFAASNRLSASDRAVILPPASQLSTSPREPRNAAERAYLLHEGTTVTIVDSISNPGEGRWYEVKVGPSDRAWVRAADVCRI